MRLWLPLGGIIFTSSAYALHLYSQYTTISKFWLSGIFGDLWGFLWLFTNLNGPLVISRNLLESLELIPRRSHQQWFTAGVRAATTFLPLVLLNSVSALFLFSRPRLLFEKSHFYYPSWKYDIYCAFCSVGLCLHQKWSFGGEKSEGHYFWGGGEIMRKKHDWIFWRKIW